VCVCESCLVGSFRFLPIAAALAALKDTFAK